MKIALPLLASSERKIGAAQAPFFRTPDRYYISLLVLALCLAPLYIIAAGRLGYKVLILLLLSILVGSAVEVISAMITKRTLSYFGIGPWILFPFLVPPGFPLWMALPGFALSLVIVQTLFGGFGKHIVHPAVFAQLMLLINFPLQFNSSFLTPFRHPAAGFYQFSSGSFTNMPDFGLFSLGLRYPIQKMLSGPHVGFIGEMVPGLILIAGLAYLILADVNLGTPVTFLSAMILFSALGSQVFPGTVLPVIPAVLGGSTLFYTFFIFSDHWTGTKTGGGRIIAGVTAAMITIIVRSFSSNMEGIMYAAIFNYAFGALFDEISLTLSRKVRRPSR